MTKTLLKVLGVSALLAAALSGTAFADTAIKTVKFQCGADSDASISAGISSPKFVVNDDDAHYTLSSYSEVNPDATNYKTARTYELTFEADEDCYFVPTSEITVEGKGITSIVSKKVDTSNNTELVVKAKAYPFYCWETPEPVLSDDGKKLSWSSVGSGATYEYLIEWTDYTGEIHYVHSTTTKTSVNTSSYVKEHTLTDSQAEKGYTDHNEINGYAVRAKGNAGENTNTAPSGWGGDSSIVSSFDDLTDDSADNWGDLYEGVSEVSGSGSSGSSYGPGGSMSNGWQGGDKTWYYYSNGKKVTGWVQDGLNWYYLNPSAGGLMSTGWVIVNSKRYYLNPNVGGPLGAMYTGVQTVDGQQYNFGTDGAVQ